MPIPEPIDAEPQAQTPTEVALQDEFNQGVALYQLGKFAAAEHVCREVLQQQPNHFDALHLLGVIALKPGHAERAIELLGRTIEPKPDFAMAYNNRGLALGNLKRHENALASFDKAIELRPDFAEAHNNRGVALTRMGRREEALVS